MSNEAAAPGAETKKSTATVIDEKVANLQAQVEQLTSKLEKKGKKKKEKSGAAGASNEKKKEKKKSEKKKATKKAEKMAAAVKAEKKAKKKAEKAAAAAAAAKKDAKKAKKKAEKAAAAAAGASSSSKKASKAPTTANSDGNAAGAGAGAGAVAEVDAQAQAASAGQGPAVVTNTEHVKMGSGKKAKTLPNSTSLTWTCDSSIDILAGQNYCFPIEIVDSRPSILEWTFQTGGGDINFSISYSRKATKQHKKKRIDIFPETRVDSFCDEHTQSDAFSGAIDQEKALATALTTFYAGCGIEKEAPATARAAKIFKDRQEEMLAHLHKKYLQASDLSKSDASLRKKAMHQLKKDLRRPPHLIHLEQGGCFKIIGSVDITGPGTVRLVWDNSFSWMRSKQLVFSVKLKARPEKQAKK